MKIINTIHRREFLKLSAVSGTFLAVGCSPMSGKQTPINMNGNPIELNQYIKIDLSGKVTLFNHRPEMGQGTFQSVPMVLAEELEVNVDEVEIKQSVANRELYGNQMVVGSRTIQTNFELLRNMGAAAKEMLIKAAANRWGVGIDQCYAENGMVKQTSGNETLGYGDLVTEASKLPAPPEPKLKDPKDFKVIGTSLKRRDTPLKVTGKAIFGSDIDVPGMLHASVERSPVFIGKVISFDDSAAKAIPGVQHVVKTQRQVWGRTREGVAVIADDYWTAQKGRKALKIKWDNKNLGRNSSESLMGDFLKASGKEGQILEENGDVIKALANGSNVVEAAYETPYQSHTCMEPMSAVVDVRDGEAEFWGSTQNPNGVKSYLAKQLNLPEEKVTVNYTFMGGGFGRRSMTDVADEAADISQKVGAPVKVTWSREDDMTQGPFRACSYNSCKGVVDKGGKLVALQHKVTAQEIRNQVGNKDEAGRQLMGGINTDYSIPNFQVRGVLQKLYIPITYWRAVYHSTNTFAHESFIDEMAVAAKKNPLDFRLAMLKDHPRFTGVLNAVADKTNWYSRKPDVGYGVAIVERSGAFIAMVAEVALVDGEIKPLKFTTAVDVGICVNPNIVQAQTNGSVVMGLTAAYKSGHTINNGQIVENNFHNYKMMTLGECPELETIVMKSYEKPEGAGEAGLPTCAPALTNAIFDLTGKRVRKLPFDLKNLA